MWLAVVCGLFLFLLVRLFFYEDDTLSDLESSHFTSLLSVAKKLEKLYHGSRVYLGIQIPDFDSGSRRHIDLVLITNQEAVVISVKNVSGIVSVDEDGNWICTGKHSRTDRIQDPVAEAKQLVSILEDYLEQRGVSVPEGYLSFKVICPNPFFRPVHSDSFPPEVITYDHWKQLKSEQSKFYPAWIKGVLLHGRQEKIQESISEKINSVLSTAPISDRLELRGDKLVLGEFIEFKGKDEDLRQLRKIKRSKVSRLSVRKISMFGLAQSTVQLLYAPRDYHGEESVGSSDWQEMTLRSSTLLVFQPLNTTRHCKYKLSSVVSLSLSA